MSSSIKLTKTLSLLSVVLFLCGTGNNGVGGSSILFFHLAGTRSHRTSIWPLAEKLADKGHSLTYIFPIHNKFGKHPGIEEITPSKMVPILSESLEDYDINFRLNNSNHLIVQKLFNMCFDLCEAFYDSPEVQEWMNRPNLHYDLVMIDASMGECIYGLVHKFKAKHVIFVPTVVPYHWDAFGIVPETSSVPLTVSFWNRPVLQAEMNFFGRLWSTVEVLLWRAGFMDYVNKVERLITKRMNITDLPPLGDFEKNTSLVLANTHFIEDFPVALPPMFQSYSGLWCSKDKMKQIKPLPDTLGKFIEGKDSDGFIYISFGSAVSAAAMPLELRKAFFDTIAAFPKLRFLWKWVGTVPEDKPDNLLLQKWFPQHDVLAHPKIKGFLMQGGRPSTQEALCHGVPLITMPVIGDQDYNADRLAYIGVSISLDVANVTVDILKNSFMEIAYNEKLRKRMAELSAMFKDRPTDPLDNTVYWTEYVLRHDTSLLKPLGMQQTWYQRRLLDVYLFLAGVLLIAISLGTLLTFLALKYLLRMVGIGRRDAGKMKAE